MTYGINIKCCKCVKWSQLYTDLEELFRMLGLKTPLTNLSDPCSVNDCKLLATELTQQHLLSTLIKICKENIFFSTTNTTTLPWRTVVCYTVSKLRLKVYYCPWTSVGLVLYKDTWCTHDTHATSDCAQMGHGLVASRHDEPLLKAKQRQLQLLIAIKYQYHCNICTTNSIQCKKYLQPSPIAWIHLLLSLILLESVSHLCDLMNESKWTRA